MNKIMKYAPSSLVWIFTCAAYWRVVEKVPGPEKWAIAVVCLYCAVIIGFALAWHVRARLKA